MADIQLSDAIIEVLICDIPQPGTRHSSEGDRLQANARPQLKVRINAGFNVGLTREEIMEAIMRMAVYSGFPSAINGVSRHERSGV